MSVTAIRERIRGLQELPIPSERRRLRVEAGVSLLDVAAALGVSHTAVSAWERGLRTPNRKLLPGYLAILRVLRDVERA
jgi:transcriptional regulator with XRE-family HTH domain